eukprot:TRINITY_DN20101_c0_g1_i1.p1 TRINITY_DN20101_c0_g1~~TRINITY_DN20101_c0_g1_i1.p1  ORF type:complete len:294 (-),score=84.25 TRINITY_DN20101_c0_g1_i1:65-946(-)
MAPVDESVTEGEAVPDAGEADEENPFAASAAQKAVDALNAAAKEQREEVARHAAEVGEVWAAYNRADVRAICRQLDAAPDDALLQREGCDALGLLASSANRQAMEDLGAPSVDAAALIVRALDAHLEVAEVQRRACQAVGRLARYGGLEVRRQLGASEAAAAVLRAMEQHVRNNAVQTEGCTALTYLLQFVPELPEGIKAKVERAKDPHHGEDPESVLYKRREQEEAANPGPWRFKSVSTEQMVREGERTMRALGIFAPEQLIDREEEERARKEAERKAEEEELAAADDDDLF